MIEKINIPVAVEDGAYEWGEEQMTALSLEQKIGQLIHIATWSNRDEAHYKEIEGQIKQYGLGGLIFFQGSPEEQAILSARYQAVSKVPLMISIDAEWGLGMRLNGVEALPYQMTLGATQNVDLARRMGEIVGAQLKTIGTQVNHAPDADVNTNPDNPVINFRSFGQDKRLVADMTAAYMHGMQEMNVMAVAKHFPGHGDTASDSHFELPLLDKSKEELKETELYPFDQLIKKGLGGVMIAHLQIPQLEKDSKRASTLSRAIVTDLLKGDLAFEGLSITDALDMKAVVEHYPPGKVDLEAFLAGNDILLFVKDVPAAIHEIKKAVEGDESLMEQLNTSVKKQLVYKHWLGLFDWHAVSIEGIEERANEGVAAFNEEAFRSALTLVHKREELPKQADKVLVITVNADGDKADAGNLAHHTLLKGALSDPENPLFEREMGRYYDDVERISVSHDEISDKKMHLLEDVKGFDHVVLALHNLKLKAHDNFGVTKEVIGLCDELAGVCRPHFVLFGNPYAARLFERLEEMSSVLITYQENKYTHQTVAEYFKGMIKAKGKLPVSINKNWPNGHGITDQ